VTELPEEVVERDTVLQTKMNVFSASHLKEQGDDAVMYPEMF